jgi:(5-formylfuran-3-yl)methyl phosphate synthase
MPPTPPKLLISVVNAQEALQAHQAGADIIDIKDPSQGPLGMPSALTIYSVVQALFPPLPLGEGRGEGRPRMHLTPILPTLSIALGELIQEPNLLDLPPTIKYAKVALRAASPSWPLHLSHIFESRPDITPVLALYAPMDEDESATLGPHFADPITAITKACQAGAEGILIDTHTKDGRSLLDTLYWPLLPQIIAHTHAQGLWIALAGSLKLHHLPSLLPLGADILGLRGGVCSNHDRNASIDPEKIKQFKSALSPSPPGAGRGPG